MAQSSNPASAPAPAPPPPPSPGVTPALVFLASPAELGNAIRAARISRGVTQAGLAARARVSRKFLIELENGKPGAHLGKALTVMMCAGLVGVVVPLEALQTATGNP